MEAGTHGNGSLPPGRMATYFPCWIWAAFLILPIQFYLQAPGQTLGELWDTGLLIFPLSVAPP